MQRRSLPGILLLSLIAAGPALAQDQEDSFEKVRSDFLKTLNKAMQAETDVSEEQALESINRCFVLADVLDDDEEIVDALNFVSAVTNSVTTDATKAAWRESVERMIADYIDEPHLVTLVFNLSPAPSADLQKEADAYLLEIRQDSTCKDVHGAIMFQRASQMMNRQSSGVLARPGEREELLALLGDLQTKYADVQDPYGRGTLGEIAGRMQFDLENLAVGMIAPEIEAADLDGISFKLSDYRGKVVLLDFWGNW